MTRTLKDAKRIADKLIEFPITEQGRQRMVMLLAAELDALLAPSPRPEPAAPPDGCNRVDVSSRCCERGTFCCTVKHGAEPAAPETPEEQLERLKRNPMFLNNEPSPTRVAPETPEPPLTTRPTTTTDEGGLTIAAVLTMLDEELRVAVTRPLHSSAFGLFQVAQTLRNRINRAEWFLIAAPPTSESPSAPLTASEARSTTEDEPKEVKYTNGKDAILRGDRGNPGDSDMAGHRASSASQSRPSPSRDDGQAGAINSGGGIDPSGAVGCKRDGSQQRSADRRTQPHDPAVFCPSVDTARPGIQIAVSLDRIRQLLFLAEKSNKDWRWALDQIGSATDSSQRSELVNGQERSAKENPLNLSAPLTAEDQETK